MAEKEKVVKKEEKEKEVKAEVKEEVKLEKKFCTNCGRELNGDEECTCMKEEIISVNKEAVKGYGKKFIDTVVNMFKNPKTTIEGEVDKKDITSNMIMLGALALAFGLYVVSIFKTMFSSIMNININNIVSIPYFKIFLYAIIIYFIISFVPIVASFIIARIVGNQKFDIKKAISLYTTSMAPMVISYLIMALLYYLNILTWIGLIIGIIISILCFFHYILGYLDNVIVNKNKKAYLLTGLVSLWIIIDILFLAVLVMNISSDLTITNSRDNSTFNSLF